MEQTMGIKKIFFLSIFTFILFSGCGLKEGTINKDQKSYLMFTGNTKKVQVYIDELEPFSINSSTNKKSVHYEISPGKHAIKVERQGKILVNRKILLGNGIIKEIKIP